MALRSVVAPAALAALALLPATAQAQFKARKQELSRIQGELKQTLQELEDLRRAENELGADVKGLENRDALSRRRLEDLQSGIRRAESRRGDLKSRLDAAKSVAGFWSAAIAAEAARSAEAGAARSDLAGTRDLWADEFRRAAIAEKGRHLRGLQGFSRATEKDAAETGRRARELDESRRRAQTERQQRRREYEEKKAALEQTQEKVAAAARRAKELEESAKALTALLDKLGKATAYKKTGPRARLELPRHSLPWPAEGRIVRGFGREKDPELGTWTVRQGALLAAAAGAAVSAVAPGKVIFAGPFRSYGRVVIVDHGDAFFSVYGELGEVSKGKGEDVSAGETLARVGEAKDGSGRLYLELRRGTEALDPSEWLEKR